VRERLPEWIATKVRPIIEAALARDQLHARLEMGGEDNDKLLRTTPRSSPAAAMFERS